MERYCIYYRKSGAHEVTGNCFAEAVQKWRNGTSMPAVGLIPTWELTRIERLDYGDNVLQVYDDPVTLTQIEAAADELNLRAAAEPPAPAPLDDFQITQAVWPHLDGEIHDHACRNMGGNDQVSDAIADTVSLLVEHLLGEGVCSVLEAQTKGREFLEEQPEPDAADAWGEIEDVREALGQQPPDSPQQRVQNKLALLRQRVRALPEEQV